jgi:diguanylate cyclase (GGDEF)-like protein/PAS domain S-box-containing protein
MEKRADETVSSVLSPEMFFAATSYSVLVTDPKQRDNPIVFVNAAFTKLTGYGWGEVVGKNCRFLQGAETDPFTVEIIRLALNNGDPIQCILLNYRKSGEPFWNRLTLDPVRGEDGNIIYFVGVQSEVTERNDIMEGYAQLAGRLKKISENIPGYAFEQVLTSDGNLHLTYVSSSLKRILGLSGDETVRIQDYHRYLHPEDRQRIARSLRKSARDVTPYKEEIRLISASGMVHWFRGEASPGVMANGDVTWNGVAVEITLEKAAQSEVSFLSAHDPLTGLKNRLTFRNAVAGVLASLAPGQQAGLFHIDLDGFQAVTDVRGDAFADMALRRVGLRLTEFAEVRGGFAGRLGGDAFSVFLSDASEATALALAETIRASLAAPIIIEGKQAALDAFVGVALTVFPSETESTAPHDLVGAIFDRAHLALQGAKQPGTPRSVLYSPRMDKRLRHQQALAQSLREAVASLTEFELFYQPIVDLSTGRIVAAEALIRWRHPSLGLQRPDLFIPLAESTGLIVPLGAWVIKQAMRQVQTWRAGGLAPPKVSVNVSSVQLTRAGLIATVEQALAETGVSAEDFEIELTESVLIDATPNIRAQLNRLKALGFALAIDDFGTGHSTFKYLRDFPIDKIKIDKGFVRDLVVGSSDESIVRAMVGLARELKLGVVVEGIETDLQREVLRKEGCDVGQGYLFSLPLNAEDFGDLLARNVALPIARAPLPTLLANAAE